MRLGYSFAFIIVLKLDTHLAHRKVDGGLEEESGRKNQHHEKERAGDEPPALSGKVHDLKTKVQGNGEGEEPQSGSDGPISGLQPLDSSTYDSDKQPHPKQHDEGDTECC